MLEAGRGRVWRPRSGIKKDLTLNADLDGDAATGQVLDCYSHAVLLFVFCYFFSAARSLALLARGLLAISVESPVRGFVVNLTTTAL